MRHRPTFAALSLVLFAAALPLDAASRRGFSLAVVVDGCEAPEYEHAGRLYVEALRGRNFSLRVVNPTSERIAVALSVDGRNVIDAKRTSAQGAAKWVLAPGETIDIPGWQVSGETSRRFFFTETSRSYAKWLGDTRNVGTIEAAFFLEKRRQPLRVPGVTGRVESEASSGEARDHAGEPAPPAAAAEPGRDAGAAQRKSEADRFAATGIGDRTDFSVQWVAFEKERNPAARIAIRYEFRRELVALGVLPRADDALAGRERARGFEPRYAPDPDSRR
ncbi:MAG TPA: hypothetical protein VLG15_05285 [Thermoanaerobaculia bacterium]|nr:hypothetical protein [Thermoanaerobaculia bacterium]